MKYYQNTFPVPRFHIRVTADEMHEDEIFGDWTAWGEAEDFQSNFLAPKRKDIINRANNCDLIWKTNRSTYYCERKIARCYNYREPRCKKRQSKIVNYHRPFSNCSRFHIGIPSQERLDVNLDVEREE